MTKSDEETAESDLWTGARPAGLETDGDRLESTYELCRET